MKIPTLGKLASYVNQHGKLSCRKLANVFNLSKSSVHRRQQKIKKRSSVLGAGFFESEEGQQWVLKLVVAAIFIFGIISGVGSERLDLFFSLLSLGSFVALSTSSLSKIENHMDDMISQYKKNQDAVIMDKSGDIEITPGGDETFFKNLMVMVMMDLESGFIFLEKPEEKRDHATWEKNTVSWLSKFKLIRCFLSDKAKALLKLANDSLSVDRIPDLFHLMNDVSSVMKYAFYRLKKSTEKSIKDKKKSLKNKAYNAIEKKRVTEYRSKIASITKQQIRYQREQRALSLSLHPFTILSSCPQTTLIVEDKMKKSLSAIRLIQTTLEINDPKNKLSRSERQIPDAAKQVDTWWGWVNTSLESIDISVREKEWEI